MASNDTLFLDSLIIDGFRAIRSVEIPDLGRVNLFVGLNNAGKTSVLEALRLYAAQGVPQAFRDVLQGRGEILSATPQSDLMDWGLMVESVEALFHGEREVREPRRFIVGGRGDDPQILSVQLRWATDAVATGGTHAEAVDYSVPVPAIEIAIGDRTVAEFLVTRLGQAVRNPRPSLSYRALYVPPCGIDEYGLGALWDRVTLTEKEKLVIRTLQIIAPEVEDLSFVMEGSDRRRRPAVKIAGSTRPVPLRTMGDGVNRVLQIALALANAENGFLLIDEVENGIHYSVQDELWTSIFDLSDQFNVQVFATTHSWDAVVGFQHAANLSRADGYLYRLDREDDGETRAVRYTQGETRIAAEHGIEVR